MGPSVVDGVEMPVELRIRLLGPITIACAGAAVAMPSSRKLRALLAYLALAPAPVTRSQLCELLWEVPNDPRGELRWCLSKLRGAIDGEGRQRVVTDGDTVRLDLADADVDVLAIARAMQDGVAGLSPDRLATLADLFAGEFLDGLEIERSPGFTTWLTAQRRRLRACHAAILERLAATTEGDQGFAHLERWLALAPFDRRVHESLLRALARQGRLREAEEHLAATAALFEAEGLDMAPIRAAWRAARGQPASVLAPPAPAARADEPPRTSRRASVAVMPFVEQQALVTLGGPGDGLAHDIITRLAKLRSLFVIAQGSVFALAERSIGPEEAGRMLNVDYVVGGSLRRQGRRLTVAVELVETRSARIVWAEIFDHALDDAFLVLDEIGNRIVASIASEIETVERNRAILKPPSSLDAWETYHRGLWHMYRFNKADNDRARHFFQAAIGLDPTFARAHAGLSFTHFQSAFQGWAPRAAEIASAYEAAGQGLMVDDRDPAAHWAMGRALWLRGTQDAAVLELEHAIELSPNFALGHYTLAFVHSQGGDAAAALDYSDHSRHLSPFDPLLFGMLGSRAMALVRLGRFPEAADWGVKAAARPNAHAHIHAIAAYSLALAGRLQEGQGHLERIRRIVPGYRVENFLTAMQIAPEGAARFREGARLLSAA